MLLFIDYGGATAKTLLLTDDGTTLWHEIPLGFPAYTKLSVMESLNYVFGHLEEAFKIKLTDGTKPLCRTYAAGEIASIYLRQFLAGEVDEPFSLLKELDLPVVAVGRGATLLDGTVYRSEPNIHEVEYWLPFQLNETEIANYIANTELFSQVIPYTPRDLEIEQAIVRFRLSQAIFNRTLRSDEIIVTGTALGRAPKLQLAFLTLLNGLAPMEPLKITLDERQVFVLLALVKKYSPENFDKIWSEEKGRLKELGTGVWTDKAKRAVINVEGQAEAQDLALSEQSLILFPLPAGEKARVRLEPGGSYVVEGGEVGLIFDSRPRPLRLPFGGKERRELLRTWEEACNAHGGVVDLW